MSTVLAWLRRLTHRDDPEPPEYDPRRDPAARWLGMKQSESKRAEREALERFRSFNRGGPTGNVMEDDVFYPPRRGERDA